MTTRESIQWFKQTLGTQLQNATQQTPYSVDLLCAIAYQETGYIWSSMAGKLPLSEIAFLAVGDTLDTPNRKAFPKDKQALLNAPNGAAMFAIAREHLVKMAKHVKGYSGAVSNPKKFCHGFGIFQYDLQHFLTNPTYFLEKKWSDVAACFSHCIEELNAAKARQCWKSKSLLTDEEKVFVAIAYNKGSANLSKGFKQGFKSTDGKFYGENIFEYLRLSQSIPATTNADTVAPPTTFAPLPPPTPVLSNKKIYKVKVTSNQLNLRTEPKVPRNNRGSNVKTKLPNGHLLSWLSGKTTDKFLEVETSLNGAYFKGYAAQEFMELVKDNTIVIPVSEPSTANPDTGIIAVYMPRAAGTITKRTAIANALSLNEPGQPVRNQTSIPADLKQSLLSIIEWLNVDKAAHKRYQPVSNSTFCNIYAHDYCFLAGVYFPRVWWTPGAIAKLAADEPVQPLYGGTIEEMRANNLFRWLRDFGERFGWRQTGELTKLQNAANIGGIGLIIARRKDDGRSGHVVMVAPENELGTAKRDANGTVLAPLQSQAGSRNFKFGRGGTDWWLGEQFAEHAFWIHA